MNAENSAIVLMASVLPQDKLIEMVEEAISEWKEARLLNKDEDEEFKKVGFMCHLVLLNIISNNSVQGAVDTMKRMEEVKHATEFFKKEIN